MSAVTLISAFGRGETLALALAAAGFQVRILDFSSAFAPEYERGLGPFPIVQKAFLPAQEDYLLEARMLNEGLTFWLKEGPIELTGPMASVHARRHPEIAAWKAGKSGGAFATSWLERFLRQWASPYFSESWALGREVGFPAGEKLSLFGAVRELELRSFERAQRVAVEVQSCTGLGDARLHAGRIEELEVDCGRTLAVEAPQWVWCLSSHETHALGATAAARLFPRGIRQPQWTWLSFNGHILPGPWSAGLPSYSVVVGDVFLPWTYANAAILRRTDDTRCRYWLKVPRARVDDIDARRSWATDLQKLLQQRLPLAQWVVNSADWGWHSEIFDGAERGETRAQWKNCDLIAPETLNRLDVSARLELEGEAFRRLAQWRAGSKKQGVQRDQTLHAP